MASEPGMAKFAKTTFGITGLSILSEVRYFDVTKCFPHDIMHVLHEGFLPCEMKHLLRYVISEKRWIKLTELNRRIEDFDYGYLDVRNKPSPIDKGILKPENKKELRQSGM